VLVATGVRLAYGATVAIADASVTVAPGEVVAVTGASGSGKTSLLYCLSGLVPLTGGSVRLDDLPLDALKPEDMAKVRRRSFGFIFQFAELIPELSLRENIGLPLELLGVRSSLRRRRVEELLEHFGLGQAAERRPAQVSGGQAQRAATARALVHRPRVVFADEPTGALDSANAASVLAALMEISRVNGSSVVLVTHDATVASAAGRTIQLRDGRVCEPGAS
jgi:putative ABC transport system ATP-binding protein